MVIAYTHDLQSLAQELSNMGFNMVEAAQTQSCDAFIYGGAQYQHLSASVPVRPTQQGTFLLNVQGLNAQQVAQLLTRRSYSPIF